MIDTVKPAEFARMCGVSRAAISKAVNATPQKLRVGADGAISLSDPLTINYLRDHPTERTGPQAKPKPQKPPKPEPEYREIPSGDLPLDDSDDDVNQDEEYTDLIELKTRAEIRLKNAQTDRHVQELATRMKLLIPREMVDQHCARVDQEIKNRLIIAPKSWTPRLFSMIKSGCTEAEARTFLENEMTASLAAIKRILEAEI